jgi:hypothetical protein
MEIKLKIKEIRELISEHGKEKARKMLPDLSRCADCGSVINSLCDDYINVHGGIVCENCKENYFLCWDCEEFHSVDDLEIYRGKKICSSCAENNYHYCSRCFEWHDEDEYVDFGRGYCTTCIDHVAWWCELCHEYHYNDVNCPNISEAEEEERNEIMPYSYKPEPVFFGGGDPEKTRYFGVELEVICNGDPVETAAKINNGILYCKNDGSLPSTGIEVVSHPATFEHLMSEKPFDKIRDKGVYSYKSDFCGLHVHVSRSGVSESTIAKIVAFFFYNPLYITKIGQRDYNNYCQKENALYPEKPKNDRYFAVNLSNENTIEFRFFKGNCAPGAVSRAVQFCEAILRFARKTGLGGLTEANFTAYVASKANRYKELNDYINNLKK